MKFIIKILLLGVLCLEFIGCISPVAGPPTSNTEIPYTLSLEPTETKVWFPPTSTHTLLPTITRSTLSVNEIHPNFGKLLFIDNFSNSDLWSQDQNPAGSVNVHLNQITLAVSITNGYLTSIRRQTTLEDFYLEITANPSICRGNDEYGLLLRVSDTMDFLRFAIMCNGYARLDRYFDGLASSPVPPTMNSSIPRGAPSVSRISVLAKDKELVFYANNVYLFSIRDQFLLSGAIGLFVRAAGEDIVSVNFNNLAVYEIDE